MAGAGHTFPEAKDNQLINKHTKTKHVSECRGLAFKKLVETMKVFVTQVSYLQILSPIPLVYLIPHNFGFRERRWMVGESGAILDMFREYCPFALRSNAKPNLAH